MWVFTAESKEELENLILQHKEQINDWILIDWWITWKILSSPNIQFNVWKTTKDDKFISCSEQILWNEWKVHLWNISNIDILKQNKKLQKDIRIILDWIRSKKAFGISGIDFIIVEEKWEQKPYFMEINWRINGSTHWPILMDKIYKNEKSPDNWAVNNNVHIPKWMNFDKFIEKLDKDGILFSKENWWVLPTNISTINPEWIWSKVMVALLNTTSKNAHEIINHLSTYGE